MLARSYVSLPSYSERPDNEQLDSARAAAEKAVGLDERLTSAHIALGMVFLIVDRNFALAEREFRRAIAINSHSSQAEGELALCLIATGRTEQAVAHARQAKVLDPLSVRAATDLGIVLYYCHRLTEAAAEFEAILKLNPYSYRAEVNLGKTYLSLGRFDDARRVLEEASRLSNHDPIADGLEAEAMALGGNIRGARTILATLEQRAQTSYVGPFSLAYALTGLGRLDDALVYLRKARDEHAIPAIFLKVDPSWESLHGNPDFRKLVGDIPPAGAG
jgi:Flp pilus assembly protein TadD